MFRIPDEFNPIEMTPNEKQSTLDIFSIISWTIFIFFTLIYLMQNIHLFVSLSKKHKTFENAKKLHKYGYIICGRNEEKVIGNLIDSIYNQDYPKELMNVFVVADNCCDNTANIARKHGATVFERFDNKNKGKSYALDYAIKKILNNKDYNDLEAFFIFDADNLLSKNYTLKMNETFDAGYQVSTSFRDSKNFNSSLTSACSSLLFLRECLIVHHSRKILDLSTFVSGTGYYVDRKIFEKMNGWNFNTFTEDIEFSCWCSKNGIQISYNEDAIFYDEQPNDLKTSNKQHFRWCKGNHQCAKLYTFSLLKMIFGFKNKRTFKERISSFEMLVHIFPFPIIAIIWFLIALITHTTFFIMGVESLSMYLSSSLTTILFQFLSLFGMALIHVIVVMIKYRKNINISLKNKIKIILTFPFFASKFIPLSFKALFAQNVTWEPIKHLENKSIKDIEKARIVKSEN